MNSDKPRLTSVPEPTLMGQVADLRRLYHHLEGRGRWDYIIDNRRLSRAISTLEELSEGHCRNNCQTRKENWREGYALAFLHYHSLPIRRETVDAASAKAWKERKNECL